VQVELGTLHTASTSFAIVTIANVRARLQLVCHMKDEGMTTLIGLLRVINHMEDQQSSMT